MLDDQVEQLGFDRVPMLRFDTKNGQRSLSVELFRNGNVILMDENDVIIQPLTHASYSDSDIKKETYIPPLRIDPNNLSLESLEEAFAESDRDLVSTLGGKSISEVSMQMLSVNMQALNRTVRRKMQMLPTF